MKQLTRALAALLVLSLLLPLAGCGATEPLPEPVPTPPSAYLPYVGDYTLFGVRHGDYIVDPAALEPEIRSVLHLEDGGLGTLEINDEAGRIGSWLISGDRIVLNPGESAMSGLYRDGIVILYMDDGGTLYYAAGDADLSEFTLVGREEYAEILAAEALAEAEREEKRRIEEMGKPSVPGEYFLYSTKRGELVTFEEEYPAEDGMRLTLREDGGGELILSFGTVELDWTLDETIFSFRDRSGFLGELSGVLKDVGVIALAMKNADGNVVYTFRRPAAEPDGDAAKTPDPDADTRR